ISVASVQDLLLTGRLVKTAETAEEFLACAADFQLGDLDTEQPHPLTARLSAQCRNDLPGAVEALKAVDRQALESMTGRLGAVPDLIAAIQATWDDGGRIFLAG